MYGLKFSWQNVCTVNVHEMYYRFNPGPSPTTPSTSTLELHRTVEKSPSKYEYAMAF